MKEETIINELMEAVTSEVQRRRSEGESDLRQILWDVAGIEKRALEQLKLLGTFTASSLTEDEDDA